MVSTEISRGIPTKMINIAKVNGWPVLSKTHGQVDIRSCKIIRSLNDFSFRENVEDALLGSSNQAPRSPFGYSAYHPRILSYSKYTGDGGRAAIGPIRHKGGYQWICLAKTTMKDILQLTWICFLHPFASATIQMLPQPIFLPKSTWAIQRLLSLILYKVVDPSRQINDDALQMLETLSVHELRAMREQVLIKLLLLETSPTPTNSSSISYWCLDDKRY